MQKIVKKIKKMKKIQILKKKKKSAASRPFCSKGKTTEPAVEWTPELKKLKLVLT